jgi:Putative transmembrane protein (PGPGW)
MSTMLLRSGAKILRRIVVTIVGVAILAVGAVMLVAPGPGFLVLALGLFVLGIEYEWARRRLEYVRQRVADLAEAAVSNPISTAGSILGGVGLVVGGVVVGVVEGLPLSGWWTGGSLIAGGLIALTTIAVSLEQARRSRRTPPSPDVSGTAATAPAPRLAEDDVSSRCRTG